MSKIMFRFKPRIKRSLSVFFKENSLWTSEKLICSPCKDIDIPNLTVDQYIFRNLDKWATKTAVICGQTNRGHTYEEVYKKSRILAANLRRKFKIKDGDTFAVVLPNVPEYPIIVFGILAAGGVVTTMNPIYTAYELQRQIILSDTALIITKDDLLPTVQQALKLCKKDLPIISLNLTETLTEGNISYKELVEDNHVDLSCLNQVKRSHNDVAFLPYSSGTTGLPKGVQLTNKNLVANCEQQNTEFRQYEYTTDELQRQIILSDTALIITKDDLLPTVQQALKLCKKDLPIISLNLTETLTEGNISYKELVEDNHVDLSCLNQVKRSHNDVAFLPYSSGTTGLPKGVQLTNKNLVANCEQQNTEFRQYEYTTATHQDSTLVIIPMFHSYGLGICMLHKMSAGLKLVTLPKFQAETFLNTLLKHRLQLLYLAPPMVLFLGYHPQVTAKHFEHISSVTCGAAPLPPADIQRLFDKAQRDINFGQGYGMTEASPLVSLTPRGQKCYEDVGYLIPNMTMRIVDGYMKNLGPGEIGELLVKGPNVMKGYLKNPQANDEVFVDGEWLRTGDLSKVDKTGLLTIVDRLKELIKVKGYQVPPAELENVLKEHPAILDAAVVGVPDEATGEKPRAFVVLQPGAKATDKEVINFVSERVAPYKKIKEVTFLDTIPKNPSGKILRKVLKDEHC